MNRIPSLTTETPVTEAEPSEIRGSGDVLAALMDAGKLRETDAQRAQRLAEAREETLGSILVNLGLVSERDLAEAQARAFGLRLLEPDDYPSEAVLGDQVSARFLKEARVVAVEEADEGILLAMADPQDEFTVRAIAVATGRAVFVCVGLAGDIENAIERQYASTREGDALEDIGSEDEIREEDIAHLKDMASEAPIIRMVNMILQRAVEMRASDIHIEPFENSLKVRYRVDGVLREGEAPPVRSTAAVISRVKIMANLNIAERRLPQDGRIKLRSQGRELDLRVSTVPTVYGESVVLRLLDRESVVLDFPALGLDGQGFERLQQILNLPHGIILVTGPTGSGKTTTLYTALNNINHSDRKIITVEDPVEYQLEGVNQIQVKPQIGLSFASALRAIVRQDPDVIMIGEMRDLETARIAVQSALTGHLVLSTLHTNDAAGGVTRLLDMGVEDYLLTSTVNGIVAQRLVRRLCDQCKEPYSPLPEMVRELKLDRFAGDGMHLHKARGCGACNGSGYRGRSSIVEVLVMSDGLRKLVLRHADAGDILQLAVSEGMHTMYEDGLRKAVQGITTLEEVIRVTEIA